MYDPNARIEWVEPFGKTNHALHCSCTCQAAVDVYRQRYSLLSLKRMKIFWQTDEEVLEDFMAVNWASFVKPLGAVPDWTETR